MIHYIPLIALALLLHHPAYAEIESDIVAGHERANPATPSELGSIIQMIDGDFNAQAVQEAFDDAKSTDNVISYDYASNKTFAVRTRVNMSTMIVLPDWEKIKAFSLADDQKFSVTVFEQDDMRNFMVIQSNIGGADTNLVAIGESGKIYNLYIRNDPINSKVVPHFTVYINSSRPLDFTDHKTDKNNDNPITLSDFNAKDLTANDLVMLERAKADYLRSLPHGNNIDLNYEMSGDAEIAPRAVYSKDGWTYFDFRQTVSSDRLPVPYKVVDGYDSVVNFRMENGFMVVESVSNEGWTLKNGNKFLCVRKS